MECVVAHRLQTLEMDHKTFTGFEVSRWSNGRSRQVAEQVAEEEAVALEYNGTTHAVMLASPADLEDFAIGFSLTEGIVTDLSELYDIEIEAREHGISVRLHIAARAFASLKERRRSLVGRTGCGLCGAESLEQVYRVPAAVTSVSRHRPRSLRSGFEQLRAGQILMQNTGATHAAGWLDSQGRLGLIREDVGRHNALDKLIGALTRSRCDFNQGGLLVTSRASYEMVLKAASVGIGFLAAISAPTALAIRLAEETNVTLVGFARDDCFVVYSHPERLHERLVYGAEP
ncbi:MAG: formate dehydrogenase accessory sulfurtransferase FdhD [Gammaproteobacteria bacterium]|nr:formate dehydrogenase accessory sulfurtransferase FdhD [Gammaproteobacteria bacterium]